MIRVTASRNRTCREATERFSSPVSEADGSLSLSEVPHDDWSATVQTVAHREAQARQTSTVGTRKCSQILSSPLAFGERTKGSRVAARGMGNGVAGLRWETPEDEVLNIVTSDWTWNQIAKEVTALKAGTPKVADERCLSQKELRETRCMRELARPPPSWNTVSLETVKNNADRSAPGVFFGHEFPWHAAGLARLGPEWLTKAFHSAGTLPENNWVTHLVIDDKVKITAGNNAGKFLFQVKYKRNDPNLHTRLFAKVPFPMSSATQTDRLSSSVYKQPMDFLEIDTYRSLEAALPVNTPKFYYGDISNETTNFILITEQVMFSEFQGVTKRRLEPFEIEGPYDKCKDWQLRRSDKEYYILLTRQIALIAAAYKQGKIPWRYGEPSTNPKDYHMEAQGVTGESPQNAMAKLKVAIKFMSETAKVLYPPYVCEERWQEKFMDTMMTLNAYSAELQYWKNHLPDYVSMGHQNLNTDNAYFWSDADGKLDCGMFDFGGFQVGNCPHKLWWMLNMAEFEQVRDNMEDYIAFFIDAYHYHGGPQLNAGVVKTMIMITALQNCMIMISAIPNSLKMCPAREFRTIKDRHDPRIAGNIDNKSTLRSCLHVLDNTVRVMEEMDGARALHQWISKTYLNDWFIPTTPKSQDVIYQSEEYVTKNTTSWG